MKSFLRFTVIAVVLLASLVIWRLSGHEQRTIGRLIHAGVVKNAEGVRLLHSTGYLRENSHVFECRRDALAIQLPTGEGASKHTAWLASQDFVMRRVRDLVDAASPHPVVWDNAQVFRSSSEVPLSLFYVVDSGEREKVWVVLMVF